MIWNKLFYKKIFLVKINLKKYFVKIMIKIKIEEKVV